MGIFEQQNRQAARRRKIGFTLAGLIFLWVWLTLAVSAWQIGSRRVDGTEGLVAQMQMLAGLFDSFFAMVIAAATAFYAFRTHDMVNLMGSQFIAAQQDARRSIVEELIAAATDALVFSALLAGAQRSSRHPWQRGYFTARVVARRQLERVAESSAAAGRAHGRLRHVAPGLRDQAGQLFDLAVLAFEKAGAGCSQEELIGLARRGHELSEQLRRASEERAAA